MKIVIYTGTKSKYSLLNYFTDSFHAALENAGAICIPLEFTTPSLLNAIHNINPDCTLSLNGIHPISQGKYLYDFTQIPHVSYLVDSPLHFMGLRNSPLSIITCVDRLAANFIKSTGFSNVLFMPHAIDKDLFAEPTQERRYQVTMLSSCIDYNHIRRSWRQKYSLPICELMDIAAEITLSDQTTPYFLSFVKAIDDNKKIMAGVDKKSLDNLALIPIINDIEMYVRGVDRIELVKAITDVTVDLFGAPSQTCGWEKYLGHKSNITFHPAVTFEQSLDISKQSRIILNSCPSFKNGAHERIFGGMACGALVITSDNAYLREQFKEGESIEFYKHREWEKVNITINNYLSDEKKRIAVVNRGREIVMQFHTWDHRAQQLLQLLPPLLEKIHQYQTNAKKTNIRLL